MKSKTAIPLALCAALPLVVPADPGGVPPQNPARVEEIAAMLPKEAGFPATRAGSAFWKRVPDAKQRRSWVLQGEATLAASKPTMDGVQFYPTPGKGVETSNWKRTVDAFFERIDRLAMAELCEDKGRFLPAIEDAIDALAVLPSWTGFYHDKQGKTFRGKGAFETALTTTGKVEELGDGVYRYFSRDGAVSACCRVKVEGGGWHFVREKLPGEVGSQWKIPGRNFPAYRQAIVLDEPVAEAKITVTWFQPPECRTNFPHRKSKTRSQE